MLTKADIEWLKEEFLPSLAEAVEKRLQSKLDTIKTTLDKLAGDIKDKRVEQKLHAGQHEEINDRLDRLEKPAGLS